MFAHLHVRSGFSFLYGAATPEVLAARGAALSLPALALTDRAGIYGAVRFTKAARKAGTRPASWTCGPASRPSSGSRGSATPSCHTATARRCRPEPSSSSITSWASSGGGAWPTTSWWCAKSWTSPAPKRIPETVRGSAAGSLVTYLICGGVDPLAQGMLFERFLGHRPPVSRLDAPVNKVLRLDSLGGPPGA